MPISFKKALTRETGTWIGHYTFTQKGTAAQNLLNWHRWCPKIWIVNISPVTTTVKIAWGRRQFDHEIILEPSQSHVEVHSPIRKEEPAELPVEEVDRHPGLLITSPNPIIVSGHITIEKLIVLGSTWSSDVYAPVATYPIDFHPIFDPETASRL